MISAVVGGNVLKVPMAVNLAVLPALMVAGLEGSAVIEIDCKEALITVNWVVAAAAGARAAVIVAVPELLPAVTKPLLTALSMVVPCSPVRVQLTDWVISFWIPLE